MAFLFNVMTSFHAISNGCSLRESDNYCETIRTVCDRDYFRIAEWYYCNRSYPSYLLLGAVCLFFFVIVDILLLTLSLIVSTYLFPHLHSLTRKLHINDHILGITIIPLMNAFPDLVNYYVALSSGSTNLVLGQLVGSITIISTVIIGVISIWKPFDINDSRHIIRGFMYLLLSLTFFTYVISDGVISLVECIIMLTAYLAYISTFIWPFKSQSEETLPLSPARSNETIDHPLNIEDVFGLLTVEERPECPLDSPVLDEHTPLLESPINEKKGIFRLIHMVIRYIELSCAFLIPFADRSDPSLTWLRFVQCFTIPYFLNFFLLGAKSLDYFAVSFSLIVIMESLSSLWDRYSEIVQSSLNVLSIGICLMATTEFSKLILQLFKNFGLILRISDYLLGSIIFAISNSVNDVITNTTVAITVDPILGLNSCLGTLLLILLLGVGINGLAVLSHKQPLNLTITKGLVITLFALILLLTFYLIYIPLNAWKLDRRMGFISIGAWVIITVINLYYG
ncbi:Piso0_003320 [Millerozyma farinosa CBS 7064]|uniref:Piso0_003320 protein n=1 Tax=Pichia sorbitophila (strain ATCC MYA-4447 / BCRC 22081 / CBS 7064 / NBRC 10061 / NRRL Y-12695) TaxID=559304 RepID=G8YIS3_PICSO|nr:Piso0_003320 [Millerozyma farinosa CBS 7064]CCE80983.1 Piso0_003320 [Millerozyma farinosa CBS 7064]